LIYPPPLGGRGVEGVDSSRRGEPSVALRLTVLWEACRLGFIFCRLRLREQGQRDLGPLTEMALCLDVPAMRLDGGLGDGQAQSGASQLPRTHLVEAVEALKDAGQLFPGDAGTAVLDADVQLTGADGGGEGDLAPRWAVLGSVLDQDQHGLLYPLAVYLHSHC
jgi:hypothetical protein